MLVKAVSHPNLALIKYWGKRDEKLFLPYNSSLSVSLDAFFTKIELSFSSKNEDEIFLKETKKIKSILGKKKEKVVRFLDIVRKNFQKNVYFKIISFSNFPQGAGIASSASFFSALSVAINKILNLNLSQKELSILSRQGSGSSCRSICGGFVLWHKGERKDGKDSFAETLFPKDWWKDFRVITLIFSLKEKKIPSREGMRICVRTSPFFRLWPKSAEKDLKEMIEGLRKKDIEIVGKIAERNALKMHALCLSSNPPIFYFSSKTLKMIEFIKKMREKNIKVYFTLDAGESLHLLSEKKFLKKILNEISKKRFVKKIFVSKPGEGAKIL